MRSGIMVIGEIDVAEDRGQVISLNIENQLIHTMLTLLEIR